MAPVVASLIVIFWSSACAFQDARQGHISHWLLYPALAAAILHLIIFKHSLLGGDRIDATVSALLALALTLPGYFLRRFGAGDVKMLLVLAFSSSVHFTLVIFAIAGVAMGLWAFTRPAVWHRLPDKFHTRLAAMSPNRTKTAYAPFLWLSIILSLALGLPLLPDER